RQENLVFVHPYDDPRVIAGQGTVALEMLADAPELEVLVVPIGGGGLISGVSTAAKALKPAIEIIGVHAPPYPPLSAPTHHPNRPSGGQSIAEGIAGKEPGELTKKIVGEKVKDILLVREDEIERAIHALLEIEKTVVEGAAAAAYAAVTGNPQMFRGKKVGIV